MVLQESSDWSKIPWGHLNSEVIPQYIETLNIGLKKNTIFVNILPSLEIRGRILHQQYSLTMGTEPWVTAGGAVSEGTTQSLQDWSCRKKYRLPSHTELHINSASFSILTMSQIVHWAY